MACVIRARRYYGASLIPEIACPEAELGKMSFQGKKRRKFRGGILAGLFGVTFIQKFIQSSRTMESKQTFS